MAGDVTPSEEDLGPIAAINVTPFVDVVLVLLVIFMITAPIILKDTVDLKLPRAESVDNKTMQSLGVVVTKQGQILANGEPVTREAMNALVVQMLAQSKDAQAVISADQDARHGDVITAIDWLKSSGLTNFAVQIERRAEN